MNLNLVTYILAKLSWSGLDGFISCILDDVFFCVYSNNGLLSCYVLSSSIINCFIQKSC